ncbi:GNAT family N-acetyltransferase [Microbulbifer hydrolyticus]|uniref:GNAT family N-acetyltransferase n=1 Tax=Microbulbifer hydrolyticus TaxID=48074 RepID=A0A6P1T920_9GAMM|nr:GNAT family N-acetyltransferase [Microbulbifer hydrolyticus]MBB5211106.1 GNAT superfamily N-acetyltransferase [Microbulbifer hydrolyticus]QHQ38110.1 GNAT family N-acetyltransferase [Microbulbifer hydrolyticus]
MSDTTRTSTTIGPSRQEFTGSSLDGGEVRHTLSDGREVSIRPVRASDGDLEREMIESLSADSSRMRFLGGIGRVSQQLIRILTDNDAQHEAFIALHRDDRGVEHAVGVANFACDPDGHSCECAVVVADSWQKLGLGKMLLRELVDAAKADGLDEIYSIESAGNNAIDHVARELGFACKADPRDYTTLRYSLSLH